jgi:hypothetical protein
MSLVEFLSFTLGCTGITVTIVLSHLLEPVREFISSKSNFLNKLINCTMCTGFWVGAVCSIWFDINPVLAGATSALLSWSVSSIVETFNTVSLYLDSHLEDEDGEKDERSIE